jgi:ABC-type antimicrobial peptide transport system permease subunit
VLLTRLQDDNTRTIRATLVTVISAVGCLLLIACMNVGTLVLGRGLGRLQEAALRAALGSGYGRLVRQFLTVSLLLAALGGAIGLAVAAVAVRLFVTWIRSACCPPRRLRSTSVRSSPQSPSSGSP